MKRCWVPLVQFLAWAVFFYATAAAADSLLPFGQTRDLYILDNGSKSVLRVSPSGDVSVAISEAEILAATGETSVGFLGRGIAFDSAGSMYFSDSGSNAILKYSGGTLAILTSNADIVAATGGASDPEAMAFGSDGFLYVNHEAFDGSGAVLKVDPSSGDVSVFTAKSALETLMGGGGVELNGGIAGAPGGVIYVASDGSPDNAVFEIASDGTPSILASGAPFVDIDGDMTRDPDGNLLVADDNGDRIHLITTSDGSVSDFLTEAEILAVLGSADVDLDGGIAFDSSGNFFIAENNEDALVKFDSSLVGSVFLTRADVAAVTGVDPEYTSGIAFAPIPELSTALLFGFGLLGLGVAGKRRR